MEWTSANATPILAAPGWRRVPHPAASRPPSPQGGGKGGHGRERRNGVTRSEHPSPHPSALMTSSVVVTAATFCMAYSIEARCQSAFMVEHPSSGMIMM